MTIYFSFIDHSMPDRMSFQAIESLFQSKQTFTFIKVRKVNGNLDSPWMWPVRVKWLLRSNCSMRNYNENLCKILNMKVVVGHRFPLLQQTIVCDHFLYPLYSTNCESVCLSQLLSAFISPFQAAALAVILIKYPCCVSFLLLLHCIHHQQSPLYRMDPSGQLLLLLPFF